MQSSTACQGRQRLFLGLLDTCFSPWVKGQKENISPFERLIEIPELEVKRGEICECIQNFPLKTESSSPP